MKKTARGLGLAMCGALLLQGCYGNFGLTRKLYDWNGHLGDKWINSVGMLVLGVLQVYTVAGIVDWVLLNTIEFWTGKNPVTMKPGEKDVQVVEYQGRKIELTATLNRIDIVALDGKSAPASLVFDPATRSWMAESAGESLRVLQLIGPEGKLADVLYPDGHKQRVELAVE